MGLFLITGWIFQGDLLRVGSRSARHGSGTAAPFAELSQTFKAVLIRRGIVAGSSSHVD
jgi:hypothetical protein